MSFSERPWPPVMDKEVLPSVLLHFQGIGDKSPAYNSIQPHCLSSEEGRQAGRGTQPAPLLVYPVFLSEEEVKDQRKDKASM